MAAIKSLKKISKKWSDRVGVAGTDYTDGVKDPRKDWEVEASSEQSEENYKAGVQTAIAQKRRPAGVKKAGTKKWQDNTIKKSTRWTEGVAGATDEMEDGYSPYHSEIEGLDYGPKFPPGDPRNLQRVKIGNEALHALKVKLKGGS